MFGAHRLVGERRESLRRRATTPVGVLPPAATPSRAPGGRRATSRRSRSPYGENARSTHAGECGQARQVPVDERAAERRALQHVHAAPAPRRCPATSRQRRAGRRPASRRGPQVGRVQGRPGGAATSRGAPRRRGARSAQRASPASAASPEAVQPVEDVGQPRPVERRVHQVERASTSSCSAAVRCAAGAGRRVTASP